MVFKGLIAAASAVALMAAPTVAAAQSAAPTVAAQRALAPAAEDAEGSELRGGFIIPLIALIAIILGLCIAANSCGIGDDDDLPVSP